MSNILEEYLVRIGAEVDRNAFNGANRAIVQLTNALKTLGSALKVGGIVSALAKVLESIASNIKAVADLDMQYQKLANSMWVTKDTAKNLKIAMDTMGATEQDIAWIPELQEQFFRLREEMNALATPVDSDNQLRWIRDIGYDIQSLQVKFKMLREWIVYYLIKYLKPYIEQFRQFIQWINKQLGDNMPKIAKKIAKFLSGIVSLAMSVFRLCKNIFSGIYDFVERIPSSVKKLALAFAAAGAAIMMSPFGLLLTAIGGAMILLQDFFYYLDGKRSSKSLAPMWRAIMQFVNGTGGNFLNTIKNAIDECIGMLQNFAETSGKDLVDLFVNGAKETYKYLKMVVEEIQFGEVIQSWANAMKSLTKGFTDLLAAFEKLLKKVNIDGNGAFSKFFKMIGYAIGAAIRQFNNFNFLVGKLMSAIALALNKDFKGAASVLGSAIKGIVAGETKILNEAVGRAFKPQSMAVSAGDNPDLEHISDKLKSAEPYIGGMLRQLGIENPEITSGYRSPEHNAAVGGAQNSWHTHGEAMDIYVGNPDPITAQAILEKFKPYFGEVLYHDAGSGMHLHVADYKGGMENLGITGPGINGGAGGSYADDQGANVKPIKENIFKEYFPEPVQGSEKKQEEGGKPATAYAVNPKSYAATETPNYVSNSESAGGFSMGNIIINVNGSNASPAEIGEAVKQKILDVRGIMAARAGGRGCLT